MTRTLISSMFAACAFFALAQPASAAEFQTRTVSVAGVDLNRAAGADIAFARLHSAARDVCDARRSIAPLSQRAHARKCADETLGEAVAELNAPLVTQRFRGQHPYVVIAMR